MKQRFVVFCALVLMASAAQITYGQEPRLGSIEFPNSGAPAAQKPFLRGVLFLHSFEYSSAAEAFREAQETDPDFALAYWGEGMTYNHPVWGERDREAASAALARLAPTPQARRAKAKTERERMYMDALETLWAEGPKAERDTAYSLAMQQLTEHFPDDLEARAFYALSLIGLSSGVRVVPTYMRAAAIVEEVFDANPRHPGAVHYLIHSYDDPIHAPLGLRAARAYSQIEPDAAHAQHMTTHIFVAMGMWDEVVSQNRIASQLSGWGPGHYTSWMGYGLVQQGRFREARAHLERAHENLGAAPSPGRRAYMNSMVAHFVINSESWQDPTLDWKIDVEGSRPVAKAIESFTRGFAAYKRGDSITARRHLGRLSALRAEADDGGAPASPSVAAVLEKELAACVAFAGGETQQAVALLREASALEEARPMEFGPPDIVKPSHELLGELLLALSRPAEAQEAFRSALALAPKRARSLLGLGRAALAAGDAKTAKRAYLQLRKVWHSADEELPELGEVERVATTGS